MIKCFNLFLLSKTFEPEVLAIFMFCDRPVQITSRALWSENSAVQCLNVHIELTLRTKLVPDDLYKAGVETISTGDSMLPDKLGL